MKKRVLNSYIKFLKEKSMMKRKLKIKHNLEFLELIKNNLNLVQIQFKSFEIQKTYLLKQNNKKIHDLDIKYSNLYNMVDEFSEFPRAEYYTYSLYYLNEIQKELA